MQLDASDLADFYEAPLGLLTRRIIARQLRLMWPSTRGSCVLGYGFAVPYLRAFQGEAERVVALMPAQQGVVAWPSVRPLSALADEAALPFPDAFFDRILVRIRIGHRRRIRATPALCPMYQPGRSASDRLHGVGRSA